MKSPYPTTLFRQFTGLRRVGFGDTHICRTLPDEEVAAALPPTTIEGLDIVRAATLSHLRPAVSASRGVSLHRSEIPRIVAIGGGTGLPVVLRGLADVLQIQFDERDPAPIGSTSQSLRWPPPLSELFLETGRQKSLLRATSRAAHPWPLSRA